MQRLAIESIAMWSVWQPAHRVFFNSYFLARESGNIVVDPLAWSEQDEVEIRERGGVAWIIITNRDHERRARDLATLFGAKIAASDGDTPLLSGPVDLRLREGDRTFPGLHVIQLEGMKSPGEIALHLPDVKTAIVGDALWGEPAGTLRLLPDDKLLDARAAVLSLRKLWALRLDALLVGDGMPILHDADRIIGDCLESRADVYVNRINLDEIPERVLEDVSPSGIKYRGSLREIGFPIGARKLGYWVVTMPPGTRFCPMHSHTREEEMFYVMDGTPTIRTPRGEFACRPGDFIAFPIGPRNAHQVLNASEAACTLLLLGMSDPAEVCHYPDSDKVMIDSLDGLVLRAHPALDYFDGELGRREWDGPLTPAI
jgi:uncharacterized cupin superfamily protein/glyoxylase-like metal-dependent hydrolase (beta-lactamase superfamily II)